MEYGIEIRHEGTIKGRKGFILTHYGLFEHIGNERKIYMGIVEVSPKGIFPRFEAFINERAAKAVSRFAESLAN